MLQGHFPERLSQLWFLNAPFIFWGLWRIVSPFIEVATREKIVFLSGTERAARLQEAIPPEVIVFVIGLQSMHRCRIESAASSPPSVTAHPRLPVTCTAGV
jgi:CRAL/TRIO domain